MPRRAEDGPEFSGVLRQRADSPWVHVRDPTHHYCIVHGALGVPGERGQQPSPSWGSPTVHTDTLSVLCALAWVPNHPLPWPQSPALGVCLSTLTANLDFSTPFSPRLPFLPSHARSTSGRPGPSTLCCSSDHNPTGGDHSDQPWVSTTPCSLPVPPKVCLATSGARRVRALCNSCPPACSEDSRPLHASVSAVYQKSG